MKYRILFSLMIFYLFQLSVFAQHYHIPVVTNLQAGLLDSASAVITSNYYDGDNSEVYHHHLFVNAGDRFNLGFGIMDTEFIGKDLLYFDAYFNILKKASGSVAFAFKALKIDGADDFLGFPELYGTFGNPGFNVTLGYSIAMNINELEFENFVTFEGLYGFGGVRVDLLKSLGSGSIRLFANNNITRSFFSEYFLFNKTGIQGEFKNLILRGGIYNVIGLENSDNRGTEIFVGAGFRFE